MRNLTKWYHQLCNDKHLKPCDYINLKHYLYIIKVLYNSKPVYNYNEVIKLYDELY